MKKICKDCKKEFEAKSNRQIRCPACQEKYRRKVKRNWKRKNKLKPGFRKRQSRTQRRKISIGGYKETLGCLEPDAPDPHLWWYDKDGNKEDKHTLVRKIGCYRNEKTGEWMNVPLKPTKERVKEWEEKCSPLKSYDSPEDKEERFFKDYMKKCNQEARKEDIQAFVKDCTAKGRKKVRRLYRYKGMIIALTDEEANQIIKEES